MHGPTTIPIRESSPNVVPPPVVPPPVVPPPLASEPSFQTPVDYDPSRSFFSRVVRDAKVGVLCLAAGLIVGQSTLMLRGQTRTADFSYVSDSIVSSQAVHEDAVVPVEDPVAVDLAIEPALSNDVVSVEAQPAAVISDEDSPNDFTNVDELADVAEVSDTTRDETPVADVRDSDPTPHAAQLVSKIESDPIQAEPPPVAVETNRDSEPSFVPLSMLESLAATPPQCKDGTCPEPVEPEAIGSLGTVLDWADTPALAYRAAKETDKLVFLIHVSGNFEIPGFT